MIIQLLAATLMLLVIAPRSSQAGEQSTKAEKEEIRLEDKCSKEAAKDLKHPQQPDNRWDALCAPPAPPPPVDPPAIEPPPIIPPMMLEPLPMPMP